MNDKPCLSCKNYDVIRVGNKTSAAHGWCVALSLYPAEGVRGRRAPAGAKRAAKGERAKPHIVEGKSVVKGCTFWRKR